MKAFTFKRYGKSPELGFDDVDFPSPGDDEILVKVYAVGLNPIDNMIPTGMFKRVLHFSLPATLGSDVSGVVVATGRRVTRFNAGDEVFASIFDRGTGSLAEFVRVPENLAALKPATPISYRQRRFRWSVSPPASADGTREAASGAESIYPGRLRWNWQFCYPTGKTPWRNGRDDNQHRQH